MSKAVVLTEWNWKRCTRNSIYFETGIFLESKMVLASGLNFLPHVLHSRIARPVFLLNPSLLISFNPENGHSSMPMEFMKSTSSFNGFLCLASYHSKMVKTIKSVDIRASENLPLRASFCLLFMFSGVPPFGERFPETAKFQEGQRSPKGSFNKIVPQFSVAPILYQF